MATISITLNIPDAAVGRVQAALAARRTSAKELLVGQLVQLVQQYEAEQRAQQVSSIDIS